ncbi:MAG: tubulin domain-containing protein [Benjaminiella poitrasii]|nr:MAG: tubulin domain-containing protein [Benjaminiella poitrasii]
MREIITLQLGSLANHVGTHFWNTQEEYFNCGNLDNTQFDEINHNVLYRQGESSSGDLTYTPRTLIYDLKGGFGSLQKYNKLYGGVDTNVQDVSWEQGINKVDRSIKSNRYQQELDRIESENDPNMDLDVLHQLDESVNNWSDYNRIYYHPRSINHITTHQMDNDLTPFDKYTIGRQAYTDNEKEVDIFEENFRFFVEECDNIQGFQIMTDVDDAFGGFTEGLLNDIRDEFAKTSILTYGLCDSYAQYRINKQKVALNRALSITRLTNLSSIYIPIYSPTEATIRHCGLSAYVRFNAFLKYHTSAIIAAAVETNSLPYRLKNNPISMADTISKLNWTNNSRLATLSVSFPLPLSEKGYSDTLENFTEKQLNSTLTFLNQTTNKSVDVYGEVVVARGLPSNWNHQSEYLEKLYSNFKDHNYPLQSRFSLENPLPLPDSFPRLFTANVNQDGYIKSSSIGQDTVRSVPILTHLESGAKLKPIIDHHLKELDEINYNNCYEYIQGSSGLSREDFLEMKEMLYSLSDSYKTDDRDEMNL